MKCSNCNREIDPDSADSQDWILKGKEVCKRCWAEALGEEIEEQPIICSKKLWEKKSAKNSGLKYREEKVK